MTGCPPGTILTSTGSCAPCPLTYSGRCVDVCPPDTLTYGTQCVASCPVPLVPVNGMCVPMSPSDQNKLCQVSLAGSVYDQASMRCVCPQGQWITRDRNNTVSLTSRCDIAYAAGTATGVSIPRIGCDTFIRGAVYVPAPLDTCQCSADLPVIMPNPNDLLLPFGCAVLNTSTPIQPCPRPSYFDFMIGKCVNMPSPSAYPTPKPSPSRTATATATATVSVSATKLRPSAEPRPSADDIKPSVSPMADDTKPSASPSSTTRSSADDNTKPSASPSSTTRSQPPTDSSAPPTMRPQPSAEKPSDPPTPRPQPTDDTTKPSSPPTTRPQPTDDIKPSEPPTPRPQPTDDTKPSSTPSAEKPSPPPTMRPQPTADDTKPSSPPTTRPQPSSPPTRRPYPSTDVVWVTRKPLPSMMAPTRVPPMRMTAMPSPWRPSRNITGDRPQYIASQIKFPGANVSMFQQPEKIQEIQMSLACALRLPLENIRITNITLIDIRGLTNIINAARFYMSSNGSVGCYVVGTISRTARRLRTLQTASSSAQVDYYIVEPTADILSLSQAEFSSVMESSAMITDLSASVGSSGILVNSEAPLAGAAPAPSNTPVADNSALIGGIVGGVAMAALVVAGVVGFAQMRKRHSQISHTRTVSRSSSVHVVKHVINPLGNPPDPSFAQRYSTSSMRLPVAFDATKTRSSV